MVALRSRRLETLFGVPLDQLTVSHVQALVASNTQESFDLDFKRDHYGRGDSEKRKLAGDVAALANTAGGVIIMGVDEDEQARAIDAPGVVVTDAETARIRLVVASLVAPVPVFDVLTVLKETGEPAHGGDDPAPAVGYIVITVPRSPQAPHAVLVNDALRFPKRNGSTTRYLSEPELAAAYRDRLAGREAQTRRIEEIEHEAIARLDVSDLPWIVTSLVPDLPSEFAISQKTYREFQQEIVSTRVALFSSSSYIRAWTGRRKLLADGTQNQAPHARWAALELHTDGSGVYAIPVADLTKQQKLWIDVSADRHEAPQVQLVDDESIAVGILSGLLSLAQQASDRAATGGGVLVRAQLYPISAQRPTQIGHTRGFGGGSRSRYSITTPPPPAETSATLDDLAIAGSELVAVACRLIDELGQSFGVPEMGQLSPDGEVRRKYWNHGRQASIVTWAETNYITVTDETIDPMQT